MEVPGSSAFTLSRINSSMHETHSPPTIAKPGIRLDCILGTQTAAIPTTRGFNIDGTPKKAKFVMIYVEDDNCVFQFVNGIFESVVANTGIRMQLAGDNPKAFNVGGLSHIAFVRAAGADGFLRIYPLESI